MSQKIRVRLEHFETAFRAACHKQGIKLNFELNNDAISQSHAYPAHQATASLLAVFFKLLESLNEKGVYETAKFGKQYAKTADKWIDLIEAEATNKDKPLDPIFYDMMLLADGELKGYFANERTELSELNLGFVVRATYNLLARSAIVNYHSIALGYMQRYHQALHTKKADILAKYPALDAAQSALSNAFTSHGQSLADQKVETVSQALKLSQQVNKKLKTLTAKKTAVTAAWNAIDGVLRVPPVRYQDDNEDSDVTASCDKLFLENKQRLAVQANLDAHWDALVTEVAEFKQQAEQLLLTAMNEPLQNIPSFESLEAPVLPKAHGPVKAQLEASKILQTQSTAQLEAMKTAQQQLAALHVTYEEYGKTYPELEATVASQIKVLASRQQQLSQTINTATKNLDTVNQHHNELQTAYSKFGQVADLEVELKVLTEQQTNAKAALETDKAQMIEISGEVLLKTAATKTAELEQQRTEIVVRLDNANSSVKECVTEFNLAKEQLINQKKTLQRLQQSKIPVRKFETKDINALETIFPSLKNKSFWNALKTEGAKGLMPLVSPKKNIKAALELLKKERAEMIAAQESVVSDNQAALSVCKQNHTSARTVAKEISQELQQHDQVIKQHQSNVTQATDLSTRIIDNTKLLKNLPKVITTKQHEINVAKQHEQAQKQLEEQRQRDINELKAQLLEKITDAKKLSDEVTVLSTAIETMVKAKQLHEDITLENEDKQYDLDQIADDLGDEMADFAERAAEIGGTVEFESDENYIAIKAALALNERSKTTNEQVITDLRNQQIKAFEKPQTTIDTLLVKFDEYRAARSYYHQVLDCLDYTVQLGAWIIGKKYQTNYDLEFGNIKSATEAVQEFAKQRNKDTHKVAVTKLSEAKTGFFRNPKFDLPAVIDTAHQELTTYSAATAA